MAESFDELRRLSALVRADVVGLSAQAGTPHLASALSCVDILVACYWKFLRFHETDAFHPNRDRFIMSKGHAATALYATLCRRGFFERELLDQYNQDGADLGEHPTPGPPGIEAATGSLGHGLGLGLGLALAGRINEYDYRTVVLMSDGECNEGSVWEAAMLAPAQKIDTLFVIIDFNKWQATGRSQQIMALDPLVDKWRSFGWDASEVDGHDIEAIVHLLKSHPPGSGRPKAIIAHTVKGKGVSFMEDDNNWHYRIPKPEEVVRARQELGVA